MTATCESGRVTLPIEQGLDDELHSIIQRLGTDAVRNSDGTWLPEAVHHLVTKIYSTYFPARGDQDFVLEHPDTTTCFYLMLPRMTSNRQRSSGH
ncbi:MAG: 1,3-beta-galactosyl-N-acetylhexosamine phosphorylase N-terminal domain-containing protein [Actinomycetaceae bacterium]|nr:1,3-beta-galactosyl-N-acetylhexosamine phosphorylase N-terminal domain-containing protein [Actinomycetaceae bacterium]